MDHVLTQHGLRLTYLCDPQTIEELDQDRILEELTDDDVPSGNLYSWLNRYHLVDYHHLILVTDRFTGRYLAFLGVTDGVTEREDFLLLESAFVASGARGQNLLRRMIALAMLRISGMRAVPSVIAACTRNPLCYHIMRETARRFTGAVFLPDPDSIVINFQTATLAQRIARAVGPNHRLQVSTGTMDGGMAIAAGTGHYHPLPREPQWDRPLDQRMLAVLDLRGMGEGAILDSARRIYRSK